MTELVIFEPSCNKNSGTEGYPDFNSDGFSDLSHSEVVDSVAGGNTHCAEVGAAPSSTGAWNQLLPHRGKDIVIASQLVMSFQELNEIVSKQSSGNLRQAVAALGGAHITAENIADFQQSITSILNEAQAEDLVVNEQSRQKVLAFREAYRVISELRGSGSEIFVAAGNTDADTSSETHFNIFALVPEATVVSSPTGSLQSSLIDETAPSEISYQLRLVDGEHQLVPLNDSQATPISLNVIPNLDQIGRIFSFGGSSLSTTRASN